ncbi:diaminopimelate epimerase [Pelosinus propionicus]|uniref:Diaminopimelate epimerase n=1 Tax=Pelosinus propionicus DSM 13327 TaxID=1123291 RepID=A0A1I4L7V9_9FIRM|nr:diaminopimelate epimerase [Pelosinus propionicus]SFL87118.1 diaminopimelate epimerase [Pelosinus propionicus DSM 13327]
MKFNFSKWHGLGNDFVIVNGFEETISNYNEMAIQVCDRYFGIGADGLVVILPSAVADFQMRIFNSDGSEAEMCGNVTRCIARYVFEYGLTNKKKITLETKAGLIKPELIFIDGVLSTIRVDMGEPRLKRGELPMVGNEDEQVVNEVLEIDGTEYRITGVSMGNPHCILFVDDIAGINLSDIGAKIETNAVFPKKTNVEFVQVLNKQNLRMRVWERGAGVTMACGTGACATLVAAVLNGKTDRQATVELDGGQLLIEWGLDNHIYMSGPAVEVFRGTYL